MHVFRVLLLVAVGAAAVMLAAAPGMAQTGDATRVKGFQKLPDRPDHRDTRYRQAASWCRTVRRHRVTVTKRSYLDPGTESKASRHDLVDSLSGRLRLTSIFYDSDRLAGELPQPDAVPELLRPARLLQVVDTAGARSGATFSRTYPPSWPGFVPAISLVETQAQGHSVPCPANRDRRNKSGDDVGV